MVEYDPTGAKANEPGSKLDGGKAPVFQGLFEYFPRACIEVANVSQWGANKYTWKGWETVPDGIKRYGDALGRHIIYETIDGPIDPDSGLLHSAQQAWNALARLELIIRERDALHKPESKDAGRGSRSTIGGGAKLLPNHDHQELLSKRHIELSNNQRCDGCLGIMQARILSQNSGAVRAEED